MKQITKIQIAAMMMTTLMNINENDVNYNNSNNKQR